MLFTHRAPARALTSVAVATAAVCALGTATATAHVRVSADNTSPGSYAVLTFKVPNESETGSPTTELSVTLPDVTSVSTEVMPGWAAHLDRDVAAGTVRSVTWTAAPGTGIGADQFALFRMSVKLPDSEAVTLPAIQTYADGTVVKWDQPTPAGGEEPEYPAPELALTGPADTVATDNANRWLAGGALAVAVVALATALLRRRS